MPMDFDGVNDLLASIGATALDNIFAGGGTLMGWIFPRSNAGFDRIMDKSSGGAGTDGYSWVIASSFSGLRFAKGFTTTNGTWNSPTNSITINVWQHIAITYDSDSVGNDPVMYIDGVSVTVTDDGVPVGTSENDAAQDFVIGNQSTTDVSDTFDGLMAEPRVYDRILSAAEIEAVALGIPDNIVDGLLARWPLNDTQPDVSGQDFYRGGSSVTIGASPTVTIPVNPDGTAQTEDDDTLIMIVVSSGDSSGVPENLTTPAGWTHMNPGQTDLPGTASTPSVWIYRRIASSEPANYVVTGNQTTTKLGTIISFPDIPATEDVISTINTGITLNPIAPSISPSAAALFIAVVAGDDDDITPGGSTNFPANVNGRQKLEATGTGNGCSMMISTELVDSGPTGTRTFAFDGSDEWGCLSIAFLVGQGVTDEYIKDVSDGAVPSLIYSAPIFKEDVDLALKGRRRAA